MRIGTPRQAGDGNETNAGTLDCRASILCYTAARCRRQDGNTGPEAMRNWNRLWVLFLLPLLLLMKPSARAQKSLETKARPAAETKAWVEKTLQKMTLREKLGQMLMPYFFGGFTSTESADYNELMYQVEENQVGGFIVG